MFAMAPAAPRTAPSSACWKIQPPWGFVPSIASLLRLAGASLLSVVVNTVKSQFVVTLFEGAKLGSQAKSSLQCRVGTEQTADLKTKFFKVR